ncbi:MAG: MarR family transcriptional regulator [Propionibacteriaceae bacterium]|nr:MarR family transcriptional regulator [Propionibacteriaceae bacterium]
MTTNVQDQVDKIMQEWERERPDIDVSPMAILGRITRLEPLIISKLVPVFAEHNMDFPAFDVLAALRRSGEPYELTPGELATSMMVTPGAVAQRLTRMELAGFITRRHDNPDRRKVTVALTPKGREAIDAAIVDHCVNEEEIISIYTDEEKEILTGLLRRLLSTLEVDFTHARRQVLRTTF